MTRSILIMTGALALAACGSGQKDQPTTVQPEAEPQAEVTPPVESMPPQGPGPEETLPGAEEEAEPGAAGQRSMGQQDMAAMCPLRVEGTTVRAEKAPGVVALVFATTGDVDELRRRVARMAEMHNQLHGVSQQHKAAQPGGEQTKVGEPVVMHRAQARTEDIESGAKIVFTPLDPAQLEALSEDIQQHATEMMLSGQCPAEGFTSLQQPGEFGGQQYGGQQPPPGVE